MLLITGSAFGTREDRQITFTGPVNLRAGTNRISLLSIAVGLPVGSLLSSHLSYLNASVASINQMRSST